MVLDPYTLGALKFLIWGGAALLVLWLVNFLFSFFRPRSLDELIRGQ